MVFVKEYVVSQIRASSEVSPYVYVSLKDPSVEEDAGQSNPFRAFSFGDMNEMMENLSRALTQQAIGGPETVLKLTEDEYRELEIRVGDRVSLQIQKTQVGIK